jgi:hypothetical protein
MGRMNLNLLYRYQEQYDQSWWTDSSDLDLF